MMRSWLFLLISAAAGAQAAPPARVEIAYEISRNGSPVAEVVQQLEHDGRSYQLAETWKGKGLYMLWGVVKRSSRGAVTADGLKPLEFTDERSGRATASAKFDWKAKTITMQYRGEPRTEPLPESARDRLSFLFEFAFAPPRSSEVTLDLFDGRGRSRHTYGVDGRERLRTPAGDFDTLRLVRANDGARAEISLATDRSHLPVRILVVGRDGTRVDQVATRISAP